VFSRTGKRAVMSLTTRHRNTAPSPLRERAATCGAARARAAVATGEGHELLALAVAALHVDKAAREVPATQVAPKLLLDATRQQTFVGFARALEELLPVLLHEAVEHVSCGLRGR
jgi:hypothetical protein